MIGRAGEVQVLYRLLSGVAAGTGAAVLVEGEAGIGKTWLMRSLTVTARRRGFRVFLGAAHPFETTRPFGALSQALELRRGSSDTRRAAIARLLDVGAGPQSDRATGQAPDVRFRVVEEIVDLVEGLSAGSAVVVALENLHWADDSTIFTFRSMVHRLAHMPVLLVGTLRPSPRSAELDLLIDELLGSGTALLRLERLGDADVVDLVRAELGAPPGPRLSRVVDRADGNPLWIVEILHLLHSDDLLEVGAMTAEAVTESLPESFRHIVLTCF